LKKDPDAAERLSILQRIDIHRRWRSLEDERLCMRCHRVITGRDIQIMEDGEGHHQLHCPSNGCEATPADWFYRGSGYQPRPPAAPDRPQKAEIDLDFL
jgi:hypothetical protein